MLAHFCATLNLVASFPTASIDHAIAHWCRTHLSGAFRPILMVFSGPGSALVIGILVSLGVLYLCWKRHWYGLAALVLTVPGGLLLNLLIKYLVHRHRPFRPGPVHHWDGYSFPSGHVIGATLLYGLLLVAVLRSIKQRHWRTLATLSAVTLILLVALSRVALLAHYLTDVVGAMAVGTIWLMLCLTLVKWVQRSIFCRSLEIDASSTM